MNKNLNIFIHIGYPKTGTTYLQQNFFSNLSQINYLGKVYEGKKFRNYEFYQLFCDTFFSKKNFYKKNISNFRNQFEKNILTSKKNKILFSDENILDSNLKYNVNLFKTLQLLNNFFKKYGKVVFIVTLRNPRNFLKSYINETVKHHILLKRKKIYFNKLLRLSKSPSTKFIYYSEIILFLKKLSSVKILFFEDLKHDQDKFLLNLLNILKIKKNKKKNIKKKKNILIKFIDIFIINITSIDYHFRVLFYPLFNLLLNNFCLKLVNDQKLKFLEKEYKKILSKRSLKLSKKNNDDYGVWGIC